MFPYLKEAVEKHIVSYCGNVQGGRERILNFIRSNLSKKEKIEELKKEYGTGGSSVTIAVYDEGFADWDSQGMKYRFYDLKTKEEERSIFFTWNQVLDLFEERYLNDN